MGGPSHAAALNLPLDLWMPGRRPHPNLGPPGALQLLTSIFISHQGPRSRWTSGRRVATLTLRLNLRVRGPRRTPFQGIEFLLLARYFAAERNAARRIQGPMAPPLGCCGGVLTAGG